MTNWDGSSLGFLLINKEYPAELKEAFKRAKNQSEILVCSIIKVKNEPLIKFHSNIDHFNLSKKIFTDDVWEEVVDDFCDLCSAKEKVSFDIWFIPRFISLYVKILSSCRNFCFRYINVYVRLTKGKLYIEKCAMDPESCEGFRDDEIYGLLRVDDQIHLLFLFNIDLKCRLVYRDIVYDFDKKFLSNWERYKNDKKMIFELKLDPRPILYSIKAPENPIDSPRIIASYMLSDLFVPLKFAEIICLGFGVGVWGSFCCRGLYDPRLLMLIWRFVGRN